MKAKTIILLIVNIFFLVGGTGCEKEKGNTLNKLIQGNWLLVEKNISDGTPSKFQSVENGYEIQFRSDGTVYSDLFSCAGTYYLGYDNILKVDFDCVAKENSSFLLISRVSFFEENGDKIVMEDPNSDEPYILVFKRIK